jgi:hypothetical protein
MLRAGVGPSAQRGGGSGFEGWPTSVTSFSKWLTHFSASCPQDMLIMDVYLCNVLRFMNGYGMKSAQAGFVEGSVGAHSTLRCPHVS